MFSVHYHCAVVEDDIPRLNRDIQKRLKAAIENRLARGPQQYGKPLRGELKSLWTLRVGDYRIVYQIQGERAVVIQIVHRRDAYQAGVLEARRRGLL